MLVINGIEIAELRHGDKLIESIHHGSETIYTNGPTNYYIRITADGKIRVSLDNKVRIHKKKR